MKKVLLSLVIVFLLIGCEESEVRQDFYTIQMGEDKFKIPAGYILDRRSRYDGSHSSIYLMAQIDDLRPIKHSEKYRKIPERNLDRVIFSVNYYEKNMSAFPDNVLESLSTNYDNVDAPDFSKKIKNGLHHIGHQKEHNIYLYIKNNRLRALLQCDFPEIFPNPACDVSQKYRKHVIAKSYASSVNLDWFANTGINGIGSLLESWRIKGE